MHAIVSPRTSLEYALRAPPPCREAGIIETLRKYCDSDVRGRDSVGALERAQSTRKMRGEWQRIGNATNEARASLLFVAFEFAALLFLFRLNHSLLLSIARAVNVWFAMQRAGKIGQIGAFGSSKRHLPPIRLERIGPRFTFCFRITGKRTVGNDSSSAIDGAGQKFSRESAFFCEGVLSRLPH